MSTVLVKKKIENRNHYTGFQRIAQFLSRKICLCEQSAKYQNIKQVPDPKSITRPGLIFQNNTASEFGDSEKAEEDHGAQQPGADLHLQFGV